MDNAPTGSKGFFNETGWMTGELFVKYLEHFVEFCRPSNDGKCLLILDGHASHTRCLQAIEYANSKGVILLSLPPHTTHKL